MAIYFISDLHLKDSADPNAKLFFKFITEFGPDITALYILGDFFERWYGDDICDPLIAPIQAAFATLNTLQVPVYFMRGNRDFLLSDVYIKQLNCIPISDPYLIELDNTRVLLTHGDLLTTADRAYQRFRKFVRLAKVQKLFLSFPKIVRQTIANYIRRNSYKNSQLKLRHNPQIFAINHAASIAMLKTYNASTLIHGHIHLPGQHYDDPQDQTLQRLVLGDWDKAAVILKYHNAGFKLITIDLGS